MPLAALATEVAPVNSARAARRAAASIKTRWHGVASRDAAVDFPVVAGVDFLVVVAVDFPVVAAAAAAGAKEVRMITMALRGAIVILAIAFAAPTASIAVSAVPKTATMIGETFATPDEAVTALVNAVRAEKLEDLRAILGSGGDKLLNSGDRVADTERRQKFVAAYDERH